MQQPNPLRGAMIGAGYFAGIQAEAWRRTPGAKIVAVADTAPGKARAFAEQWGIPHAHERVEEMLAAHQLDFADVATRPEPRRALTSLAARHGLHVICQKPMAPTWEDSLGMVEDCERAGVRLLVHENWRWQPWYREARRLIDMGRLGRLLQLTFQWRTADGVGPEPYPVQPYFRGMPRLLVYEALVHLLDTYRFLAGEIESVFCQMRRINPAILGEDQAIIQTSFRNGALGLIEGNRVSGPARFLPAAGSLLVDGDRARLRMDPEGRLSIAAGGGDEQAHAYPIPAEGYRGDSVRATQAHLIECLRAQAPCESEGREYLKTVLAVLACYESADTGRAVKLGG